jgi:FkbM family methyltransferase
MMLANQTRMLPRAAYYGARRLTRSLRNIFRKDSYGMTWREEARLRLAPRLVHTRTQLLGKPLEITDPYWHLYCYEEIFKDEIYRFQTDSPAPFIIDCGANIGLSVIYFKHLYAQARIIAFEPDAEIFKVLERNVKTFQFSDISLCQQAVWNSETELTFQGDGSVGGRLGENGAQGSRVKTARLKNLLNQKVDFLKIDVEGAEYEVLKDCADSLGNVDYLFVEHHGIEDGAKTLDEILRIIRNAGFQYHLKEAWPIKHPFLREERTGYSLQLNIFAFRNSG